MSKAENTLDDYLNRNVKEWIDEVPVSDLSDEARAFILNEAKKSIILARLRGLGAGTRDAILQEPGRLLHPVNATLAALSGGAYIPIHAATMTTIDAFDKAKQYGESVKKYKEMRDSLEKQGASMNYGGVIGRSVANHSKKELGSLAVTIPSTLDNPYTEGTFSGSLRDDDDKAQLYKAIMERMEQVNPEELRDTVVHLGATRVLQDAFRPVLGRNKSLGKRIIGTLLLPYNVLTKTLQNRERADHYDPLSDSVALYSDNPAVLTHELGHAIDINRKNKKIKENDDSYDEIIEMERRANQESSKNLRKAFKDMPETLSALQVLRLRTLPRGFYTYNNAWDPDTRDLTNPYDSKSIKSLARSGRIDYSGIIPEHIDLSSKELIDLLKKQLRSK